MVCSFSSEIIFQKAEKHCRWKTALRSKYHEIHPEIYKNQSFEEIFWDIYRIYKIDDNVKGVGYLTMYDLTSDICRYHKKNIDNVYIIGKGPKEAIKQLQLQPKTHRITNTIKIKYVEINDLISGFDRYGFKLEDTMRNTKNGDILKTFICRWQKTQRNLRQ